MRGFLAVLSLAIAGGASADLLWDNGDFDGDGAVGNGEGTHTWFGEIDVEVADDFEVGDPPGWHVTGLHFEGLCFFGNLQVEYITVEFFEDGGDTLPVEHPFFSQHVRDISVSDYFDPDWGYYHVDIDVNSFGPVALDPGYYWIMMQPYGLWDDWFYQGCPASQWGEYCAVRDYFEWYDWEHYYEYDINFKMYGEVVPEPVTFTAVAGLALGIAGIVRRR